MKSVLSICFVSAMISIIGFCDSYDGICGNCYRGNQPDSTKKEPYTRVRCTQTDQEGYNEWVTSNMNAFYIHGDDVLPSGTHNYDMFGQKVKGDTTYTSEIVNVKHTTNEETWHNIYLVNQAVPPQKGGGE